MTSKHRKFLTDKMVAKLRPKAGRYVVPDPECRGHYVRVMSSGVKSFVAVARKPVGQQVWATIGPTGHFGIAEAREKAREAIKRIKDGKTPFEAPPPAPDTFAAVAEEYVKRHVEARGLRSQDEIKRILARYILPRWAKLEFAAIGRGDITSLLDAVEDAHGLRQADYVLAIISGIMNRHASRSDNYVSAVVKGMRRGDPASRKRARILTDDELRIVWTVAEGNGSYGALVLLALLTAQRREKLGTMKWDDVTVDGIWNMAVEKSENGKTREKGTGGELVLPEIALAIIRAQPRVGENPYVFPGRGDGHFASWPPRKRVFDLKVAKARGDAGPLPPWVFHDLRRTARSLMSRAGVRPDIGERVMGHVIGGVEGRYDRHDYKPEKADALRRLAALIANILRPPADKVVPLHGVKA